MEPSKWTTWEKTFAGKAAQEAAERDIRARFEPLPAPEFDYDLVVAGTQSRLSFRHWADFIEVRKLMRAAYPDWKDELKHRFYCNDCITTWACKEHPEIEIWFQCKLEEYPAELQSETCRWVSQGHASPVFAFACEVGQ